MKNIKNFIFKRHSVILSVTLVLVLMAATFTGVAVAKQIAAAITPQVSYYVRGDVDMDGEVQAADARLALRGSIGLENYAPGSPEFLRADFNGDGDLTAGDARAILRVAVGLTPDHGQIFNPELDDYYTLHPDDPDKPTEPDEPTNPTEPEYPTDPVIPQDPHVFKLSDGREIPDTVDEWYKTFSYDGKNVNDLNRLYDSVDFDHDAMNKLFPGYSCGCKNHPCKNPLTHYNMVRDEIRGCTVCGSHECPSIYSGNYKDCPAYVPGSENICPKCGMPYGKGLDKCKSYIKSCYCPICGQYCEGEACHHCPGNPNGNYEKYYDMWTGEKLP